MRQLPRGGGADVEPASPDKIAPGGVIIDALFGAGLDRPVEGLARAMIEAMNGASGHIIAVDLPSGINGNTGAVMGAAVRAQQSVTFFRKKPGHLLMPGRQHCGDVRSRTLVFDADVLDDIRPQTFANAPSLWLRRVSGAASRRPQIFARPCGRRFRRHVVYRRGAACGAGRIAGRGRACHDRVAARCAARSMRRRTPR